MFKGVLVGLLLAVVKTAWETSHVQVETVRRGRRDPSARRVGQRDLPAAAQDPGPAGGPADGPGVELDLGGLRHVDHACGMALAAWEEEHNSRAREGASPSERSAGAGHTPV